MERPPSSPLAFRTNQCIARYDELCALKNIEHEPQYGNITDTASRFRLWAGNLGTYHQASDLRSADYRLREAPMIVHHLSCVLDELFDTLGDIQDLVTGQRLDQSQIQPGVAEDDSTDEMRQLDQVGQSDESEPTSELQELCYALPDLLTSLFKVSILIRKNTTRDRYVKAAAMAYDTFLPEFDVAHVSEKFPKTRDQEWLRYRLGNAITKRRQYLRYIRDHRDSLARKLVPSTVIGINNQMTTAYTTTNNPSEAKMSSHPTVAETTASTLQASNIQMQQISQEMSHDLDDDFSDTKSLATSFVSSRASDEHSGKLRVLRLEDMQKYGPEFECPYCGGIVKARKQRSWKRHVLRDLRAYVCTFKECAAGLFEDKKEWFKHELEQHRRQWSCPNCPGRLFDSATALRKHLLSKHMNAALMKFADAAVEANSRPVTEIAASTCPLCDAWDEKLREEAAQKAVSIPSDNEVMMPLQQFQNHLAGHLEQLALFAIPPIVHREVDSEAGSHHERDKDDTGILAYVNQIGEHISGEESDGSQSGAPNTAAEEPPVAASTSENDLANFYSSWKSRNKILHTLLPLRSLPATSGRPRTVYFFLTIPPEISEKLRVPGGEDLKVLLGCANRHYQVMAGVEFPRFIEIYINGEQVVHDFHGLEKETKSLKPVDLTPYIRSNRSDNNVHLKYATDSTSFNVAVYLVEDKTRVDQATNEQSPTSQFQHQPTLRAGLDPELITQITQQVTEKVMSGLKRGAGTADEALDAQAASFGVSESRDFYNAHAGHSGNDSNDLALELHPQLAPLIKEEVMDQLKQRMEQMGTDTGPPSVADSMIISETIKRAMRAEVHELTSPQADPEQEDSVSRGFAKSKAEQDLEAGEDSEDADSNDDSDDGSVLMRGYDSPDAVMSRCMFCGQVEEHGPGEDFEEYLVCSVCGRNAHRECAKRSASMVAGGFASQWRCNDCVGKGLGLKSYQYPQGSQKDTGAFHNRTQQMSDQHMVPSVISYTEPSGKEAQWGADIDEGAKIRVNTMLELEPQRSTYDELEETLQVLEDTEYLSFDHVRELRSGATYRRKEQTAIPPSGQAVEAADIGNPVDSAAQERSNRSEGDWTKSIIAEIFQQFNDDDDKAETERSLLDDGDQYQ